MESNLSFWERNIFFDEVDIAIIGSGIVGLHAALELKATNKHLKIIVLERGNLSMGGQFAKCGVCLFW